MKKLIPFLKQYKKQVVFGPIFKFIEAVFELIVPLVAAKIIDVGIKENRPAYIWQMGGIMLSLGVFGLASSLVCQYMASVASQGVGTKLRSALFEKINTLSHKELDEIGTPSLITRVTNDVNQLQVAVAMLIRLVVRAPFLVVGATVMSAFIDLELSLIFFATIPVIALILYLVISKSIPQYKKIQRLLDKISRITRENLSGARVIRAFAKQDHENKRFSDDAEDFSRAAIRVGRLSALLNPLSYAVMNIAVIGIIWFGGFKVDNGTLEQGEIIALVNYMTQILLALVVVANLVVLFTKSAASAARVEEVLSLEPAFTEGKGGFITVDSAPKIEFKNISFGYNDGGDLALSNINLTIRKGEIVGIIGGTGSGKSTLVSLIPRFFDVNSGEVCVDGINVKNYTFEQLRGKIGLVPQRSVLFSGTIRENLRWRAETATDGEIWAAIETAQAKDFVEKLPDGLDTMIMQGGKNLSGGQRQRLTIARALVGNPEILILDDSASALDYATDSRLRSAIRRLSSDMTVIIVSQRAASVLHADQILVLDDGENVGLGTHDELRKTCEIYAEICTTQLGEEAENA